jgi:hypothetical protein
MNEQTKADLSRIIDSINEGFRIIGNCLEGIYMILDEETGSDIAKKQPEDNKKNVLGKPLYDTVRIIKAKKNISRFFNEKLLEITKKSNTLKGFKYQCVFSTRFEKNNLTGKCEIIPDENSSYINLIGYARPANTVSYEIDPDLILKKMLDKKIKDELGFILNEKLQHRIDVMYPEPCELSKGYYNCLITIM